MFWSKKSPAAGMSDLVPADSPASEALILICEKCGKKASSDPDNNPSRTIQQALKEKIRSEGKKGKVRAVLTSCMDICPDGKIAIGISAAEKTDQYFTTSGDAEEVARLIARLLITS